MKDFLIGFVICLWPGVVIYLIGAYNWRSWGWMNEPVKEVAKELVGWTKEKRHGQRPKA